MTRLLQRHDRAKFDGWIRQHTSETDQTEEAPFQGLSAVCMLVHLLFHQA